MFTAMTTLAARLEACLHDPTDKRQREALADWLEEQGDWRGPVLRSDPHLVPFLAKLRSAKSTPKRDIHAIVERGGGDALVVLAEFLGLAKPFVGNPERPRIIDRTFECIWQFLTHTPGARCVETLVERARNESWGRQRLANLASRLVYGQPTEVLLEILSRQGDHPTPFDFWSLLAHEMVVSGTDLSDHPVAQRIRQELQRRQDPLAALPLYLTDMEYTAAKQYPARLGGIKHWPGALLDLPIRGERLCERSEDQPAAFSEADDPETRERIASAVAMWRRHPDDRVVAQVFQASMPLDDEAATVKFLRGLSLTCLEGANSQQIEARRVTAGYVFHALFAAASEGALCQDGLGRIRGRLAAFQSLGALAGAPPNADADEIACRAGQCLWIRFRAQSRFFYDKDADLGLAALRPDRRSLAVLAASGDGIW